MRTKQQRQEIATQNRASEAYENERYRYSHSRYYHVWWVEDMIASTPDKGLWLDLGCGTGWIHEVLRMKGYRRRLVGVDIAFGMLRFAKRKHMRAVLGDAEHLPFEDNQFDGVLAKGVLHHLPDMKAAVAEIARVLRPGGSAVLADPNLSPLRALRFALKNRAMHFSPLHRALHPRDYARQIAPFLNIVDVSYFGLLAYPAAFPDILPFRVSEKQIKRLIRIDQTLAKTPLLNRFCWAFKLTARKAFSE
jgi:ubiquinone/menaquinone biosynthesis C-methylase UbiE